MQQEGEDSDIELRLIGDAAHCFRSGLQFHTCLDRRKAKRSSRQKVNLVSVVPLALGKEPRD